VTVDVVSGSLSLVVKDNGCGIPEEGRRSGLRNMAGRAEKLGGEFRTTAAEGGGTELEWRVPVPAAENGRDVDPADRYPLR
jgi:signal transduction histidine kinase